MIDLSPMRAVERRPGAAPRDGAGRRDLARRGRRDAALRPRGAGRPGLGHRRGRPHARRRHRLAASQVRAQLRQPGRRRARDRRRARWSGRPQTRTRIFSGRCAAAVATSASSPRSSSACTRWVPRSPTRSCSTTAPRRGRRCARFRELGGGMPRSSRRSPSPAACPRAWRACPPRRVGRPMLAVAAAYVGPPDDGERGLRAAAQPGDAHSPTSAAACPTRMLQQFLDEDYPRGRHYYWKSAALAELSDAVIDVVAEYAASQPSPLSTIDVWLMGGALRESRPAAPPTRAAPPAISSTPRPTGTTRRTTRPTSPGRGSSSRPSSRTRSATTSTSPGCSRRARSSCARASAPHYERLVEVKTKWDPDNLFRLNHNVPPRRFEEAA